MSLAFPALEGVRVLLVARDETDDRLLLRCCLTDLGNAVVAEVDAAREALGVVGALDPDLLLVDVGAMDPDLDTLIAELRSVEAARGRPALVVGLAEEAGARPVFDAFDACLPWVRDVMALVASIQTVVRERWPLGAEAAAESARSRAERQWIR